MLDLSYSNAFKKDLKKSEKRGKDMAKLLDIIETIRKRNPLDPKHRNHKLKGGISGPVGMPCRTRLAFCLRSCWQCALLPSNRYPF